MRIWKKYSNLLQKTIKDVSQDVTKTIKENSIENNKALSNSNYKVLENLNNRGLIPSYFLSSQCKIINTENTSQIVTLYNIFVTFRFTEKPELQRDLLKTMTNKNYDVHFAKLWHKKVTDDFAKEMHFDIRALGNKNTREKSLKKLLKSPVIMALGGFPNYFYVKILMNYVIYWIYYYQRKLLEKTLT